MQRRVVIAILSLLLPAVGRTQHADAPDRPYDHFLYIRGHTLVLTEVKPGGLYQRDVCRDLDSRMKPFCVARGKLYVLRNHQLLEIDLGTGMRRKFPGHIEPYVHDAGRLYAVLAQRHAEDRPGVLRILDFRRGLFRELPWRHPKRHGQFIAVSPDHRRLAYATCEALPKRDRIEWLPNGGWKYPAGPGGYLVTILDLETGAETQPGRRLDYSQPMESSSITFGLPLAWLDTRTILCVHDRDTGGELTPLGAMSYALTTMDALTGETEEISAVPGVLNTVRLAQEASGQTAYVDITAGNRADWGRYRIDRATRTLVKDDRIKGEFRLSGVPGKTKQLFFGERLLGEARVRRYVSVSPDAQRVVWYGVTDGTVRNELQCFDATSDSVGTAAKDWASSFLHWCSAEELKKSATQEEADGWLPLDELLYAGGGQGPPSLPIELRRGWRRVASWAGRARAKDGILHKAGASEPVRFEMLDPDKRCVWVRGIDPPIDPVAYPVLAMKYTARGLNPNTKSYTIWLDDGTGPSRGGLAAVVQRELTVDGNVHGLEQDLRTVRQRGPKQHGSGYGPRGPIRTLALGVQCGRQAPCELEVFDICFLADGTDVPEPKFVVEFMGTNNTILIHPIEANFPDEQLRLLTRVDQGHWQKQLRLGPIPRGKHRVQVECSLSDRYSHPALFESTVNVTGTIDDVVKAAVEQLSATMFRDRQAAQQTLLSYGTFVVPYLEGLENHEDPDVRRRVRRILRAVSE